MKVSVYALLESDTQATRYVGITKHPLEVRLAGHVNEAVTGGRTRKSTWIRTLLKRGAQPVIVEIEQTDEDGWQEAETRWIHHLRDDLGHRLVNGTDGGLGVVNPSPEERARRAEWMREKMTGQPKKWAWEPRELSDESRERMRQAALSRAPLSEESRRRLSEAAKARWKRTREQGAPCDCRRCTIRRKNPRVIAAQNAPKLPKKSNHTRYHTNRGVAKSGCFYCERS